MGSMEPGTTWRSTNRGTTRGCRRNRKTGSSSGWARPCARPALLMAVRDATLGQVVGRELQRNLIAIHDLDAIAAESSGHRRQHGSACVEFDREHSGFELFNYFTEYFNAVFFGQIVFLWLQSGSEAGSGEGLLDRTRRNGQFNELLASVSHF